MGKKYIIELLDKCNSKLKGIMLFGLTQEKQISVELIPEEELTRYTEPDLEQVRKEAYQQGYEQGYKDGYNEPGKNQQEAYQRGMDDANRDGEYNADDGWYVMQKISLLPNPIKTELFGTAETAVILQDNSFKDALAKLAEYEQEKDRQARIEYNFDEIKDVLETTAKECNVSLDEIAEVLRKMRESE